MFFKSSLQEQQQLLSEGQTRWPGHGNCFSYPISHMLTQARAQTKQTELLWLILWIFSPYLNKTKFKPFSSDVPDPLHRNSGQKCICFLSLSRAWCNASNTGELKQGIQIEPPRQPRLLPFLSLTFSRRRLGDETAQLEFPICWFKFRRGW